MNPLTTALPLPATTVRHHEGNAMLLHEALARARMQELQAVAREHDLVRQATAGRRWEMLARFAARRAQRARAGSRGASLSAGLGSAV